MARLPYASPEATRAEAPDLVQRIIDERGGMLHLYAMLLQSPPMADGWRALLTAVRQKGQLSGALRELLIIRVAHLNHAPYEAEQHRPIALREGLTAEQVDAISDWKNCDVYDLAQRAALALCDEMTRDVTVRDATFAELKSQFNTREIVEIVITVAAYNMVSRVLAALDIHSVDDMGDWA